jgi:DNA replication protein DnaC
MIPMPHRKQTDEKIREQLLEHLQTLGVPMSAEQVDQALAAADKQKSSRLRFLEQFLATPANQRRERSIERRLRMARFRDPGTLESFDWAFNENTIDRLQFDELATGEFIRRRDNLVFVGESGLGKSHLVQSIGRRCCSLGYRIRYTTSAELMEDLTAASGDKTLPRRVRYYSRFDLLIVDEFGFEKLERREYPEAPSLLYKVIDSRSQRGSTALVTNVSFDAWTDYLGDPPLAMALLDRVVDGAIIQTFKGKSYRAHRAKKPRPSNGNGHGKAKS